MGIQSKDYFTGKMFRRQFAPALISAGGLALGDMADAIVVGQRMGVTGLAAVSLALPVFMVINVLMHGFGIGGSVRYSNSLAQGKEEEARAGFQGVLGIAAGISILLALAGNLFLPLLLAVLGATGGSSALYETSRIYVQIIVTGMPLFFIAYILNYYLRNADCERLAGAGFTAGNLSDILLNIVFVLVLDMGVAGAAWATLAGQVISIGFYLSHSLKKRSALRLFPFRPRLEGAFSCLRSGFATSAQYLFSMVFILIANHVLMGSAGSVGVAVFDMVQNASFLILYLYDGTAKAAQPLLSTYCGERNEAGKGKVLRLALGWGTAAGGTAMVLVALFPEAICHLFGLTGPEAVRMGCYALTVFCTGAGFGGISILLESYGQSCGEERSAFVLTTLRGAAVLIPMTLLFSSFGGNAFWWLFPATEIVTLLVYVLWRTFFHQKQPGFNPQRIYSGTIQGTNEELMPLILGIEGFCGLWGATAKQSYFVTMAAEELCTAIMAKGFDKGSGYIQITLIAEEKGDFVLHIRDSAVSFDPFSLHTKRVSGSGDFDMDAMGVLVIREKAKEFFYRRYQGFNTLIVRI